MQTAPARWIVATLLVGQSVAVAHALGAVTAPATLSATEAVRAAVLQRLGGEVEVSVVLVGLTGEGAVFREARPDPVARLGGPVRFTLLMDRGLSLPTVATVRVEGPRVVALRAIARGTRVTDEDIAVLRGEITGVPLKRLPTAIEIVGTRALRPIAAGATVLSTDVAIRRAVEQGDVVTVVAAAGAVEITANLTAADGGQPGDVIRVVNPDTKRFLRARILKRGLVEVTDGR